MTILVGCDYGLVKSGIVVLDGDSGEILSQNLIRVRSKGAQRLVDIERGFHQIVSPYLNQEIQIFVEGYAYGAKYQRESLAELGGVMRRYFCINNLDYWVIPPTSLKSFVTGTGKASKNYVKKCTKEKWNIAFKSDDVCDAHGLARLGWTVLTAIKNDETNHHCNDYHEQLILKDILENKEHYLNHNTAGRKKRKRI